MVEISPQPFEKISFTGPLLLKHKMRPRLQHHLIPVVLYLALSRAAVPQVTEFSAPVIGISDGDTIRVLHEGVSKRIRLFGVGSFQ
jgi:endonuclease YncB( thermonuclease family)